MKKFASLILVLVTMLLFSNQLVFADGKGKKVEFTRDMIINGTEVKKGKYKAQFDEQTNEILIWQGDKVIAKSTARKGTHKSNRKAIGTEVLIFKQDDKNFLKGLTLAGEQEIILLDMKNVDVSPQ